MKQYFDDSEQRVLAGKAERGNDAAKDLLTIWNHSRMAYNAIGALVESLRIAKSNGYETGRASEFLEGLIAEIAAYYTESEKRSIVDQANNYARTSTSCKLMAREISD